MARSCFAEWPGVCFAVNIPAAPSGDGAAQNESTAGDKGEAGIRQEPPPVSELPAPGGLA